MAESVLFQGLMVCGFSVCAVCAVSVLYYVDSKVRTQPLSLISQQPTHRRKVDVADFLKLGDMEGRNFSFLSQICIGPQMEW